MPDSRCTSFTENVARLKVATVNWFGLVKSGAPIKEILYPSDRRNYSIGHNLKNIIVELLRHWTGKCP